MVMDDSKEQKQKCPGYATATDSASSHSAWFHFPDTALSSDPAKDSYPREFPVSEPTGLLVSLPAWGESRADICCVEPICF